MKLLRSTLCLTLSLPLWLSCSSSTSKATYPDELDYCEHYMLDRNISQYGVIFIADGDTLRGGLDTGADRTVVEGRYHKREDLLPKAPIRNAHDSIMHWHQLRLKDFKWGDVHMQNLIVYVNDGGNAATGYKDTSVLGRDVLQGSIVQFDHENNLIRLSRDKRKLKGRGQEIPCRFDDRDRVFVPILLPNGEVLDFLLDTGFSGELMINTKTSKINGIFEKPLVWHKQEKQRILSGTITLGDISLGGKVYPKSSITLETRGGHLLGTHFLSRFKSFTIDYIEKKLYLEFPEEYPTFPQMNFKRDTIDAVPLDHLATILQDYNSYGFQIERRGGVFTIPRIEASLEAKQISLGDTLIGVNKKLFAAQYQGYFVGQDKVELCLDQREQDIENNYALAQSNKATFYFLKNGKPRTLQLERMKYLKHVPTFGYTYTPSPQKREGISLMLYPNNITRKLSIHIPWSPLIDGYIVEVDGIDDKGKTVPLSNRPAKASLEEIKK